MFASRFGFCHSLVDILASACAGVSGNECRYVRADRCGSESENEQENDKH